MTKVPAVSVVRLKADQDLRLKWRQRRGNTKPSRATLASPNGRRASVSLWGPLPSFCRGSVVRKRKTNIQPINFSGPAVLELCWTKQPRSLCLPAPGAEAFGGLLCCYRSSRIEMSPAALGPLIVLILKKTHFRSSECWVRLQPRPRRAAGAEGIQPGP